MKNSCIVAAIHEPRFIQGLDFIKSYNTYFEDEDIFLVFSSQEEQDKFNSIAANLKYRSIICNEEIGSSPITQKKIFGLNYIFNNTSFDKVGVIDVDTVFLRHIDYDKHFEQWIQNKKIYSTYSSTDLNPHIASPTKFFNSLDQENIYQKTHQHKAYFWFNDIPIYSKQYFLDFIQYINYKENKNKLTYHDFDYIMYGYYLIIRNLATLDFLKINNQIINVPFGFLEYEHVFNKNDFEKIIKCYKPMWLIQKNIDLELMENVFIRFHTDR